MTSVCLLILAMIAVLQVTAETTCRERLGVEDGRITDSQLTASSESSAHAVYHGANNARLNRGAQTGTTGSWSAQNNDIHQWIQAALGRLTWVSGVEMQGRPDCCQQWVTKYKVQYSNDGIYWKFVQQTNNQGEKVFDGNTDENTVVTGLFPTPVTASYIRIVPIAWSGHISMRFEVIGCQANIGQDPAGVEDGRITDSQLTASSEFAHAVYHGVTNARLNRAATSGTTESWSAQTNDVNQWVQAELTGETWVTGVMIQGRGDDCCPQWVSKFKVQHSKDGNFWQYVLTALNAQTDMEFDGSTDPNTVVVVIFPYPVRASFIRIRPTAWESHISMRFEVLTC